MMTERETLYRGTSHAAWGYLFLYLNFNLGTVNILPSFVGYLLFLSAIRRLSAQQRDLVLLRPLGILLALWSGADWLVACLGLTLDGRFPALDLIVGTASLYFQFQFLTDCAALAAKYQQPGDELDCRLLRWRTVQTILVTVMTLMYYPIELVRDDDWGYAAVSVVLAIISCIVALCLMAALFSLRKLFRESSPA